VQIVSGQNALEDLKVKMKKEYTFDTVGEFIDLSKQLPTNVPIGVRDSADWIEARTQCTELYLLWYEGMSNLGYNIGSKSVYDTYESTPDTVETNEQIQARITANTKVKYKKQAVSTLLDTEQRLKLFVKNAYERRKRQKFELELMKFGQPYEELSSTIMDQVMVRELSFVLYENKLKRKKDLESKEQITVKN
jgi:hypothetical protein